MLFETAYNIYVDSRFCSVSDNDGMVLSPLSIDDDGIAVYKFTQQSGVPNINHVTRINEKTTTNQVITGTKGSRLKFTLIPNDNLTSDNYFNKYGYTDTNNIVTSKTFKVLRMNVKVVGVTTGYTLDIPVLFVKYVP